MSISITTIEEAIQKTKKESMAVLAEQKIVTDKLQRIFDVFAHSQAEIRPHFIMTGPSGSGKSHIIQKLAAKSGCGFLEINAAQLTKEGTSGNSLSKALAPLSSMASKIAICFVDEFDKLFISGNSNSMLAHEITNGVQNEFLKILESDTTSVFGDYGKYNEMSVSNVLFIFAGAFNGEEELDIDKLRGFGIKTEFLGRVGLVFNLQRLSLASMRTALEHSELLEKYLALFDDVDRNQAISEIFAVVERNHQHNTLGIRLLNTLINQYFINDGVLEKAEVDKLAFQKKLRFGKDI